jgi:deoxyribodipyrimidine photo-lyase
LRGILDANGRHARYVPRQAHCTDTDASKVDDNRAFSAASILAQKHNVPLVALFILSPQDYVAHDRGARRIDFVLRNLDVLKEDLDKLNIPFYVTSHAPRKTLPQKVIELMQSWGAKSLFANVGKAYRHDGHSRF